MIPGDDNVLDKATPPQRKSYKELCARYKEDAQSLYYDGYGALMCEFKNIVIGIEKDGYAHS